ncbi:MAG: MFS transporter [Rhodospirillales bacterium]|nr:MFS transporter [Rhodospirillales bacterium]
MLKTNETDTSESTENPTLRPVNRWFVVAGTTSVQATMSLAVLMLSAIAPTVGKALMIPEAWIGYQVSLVFGSAALFSLVAGGFVRRWGACRASQTSLVLGLAGCAFATIPHVASIAAASIFVGVGYALTNPSASHLLTRFAGTKRRNLVFSIKQTGVPMGGALAGLIAPIIAVYAGWQVVPVVVGIFLIVLMIVLQVDRRRWDDDRAPDWPLIGALLKGMSIIWNRKPIRFLVSASFFYTATQLSLIAFLVNLLEIEAGMSGVEAGLVLSIVQIASVFGRLMWGWIADKVGNGLATLAVIGLIAGLTAALSTQVGPGWPVIGIQVLFVVFGMAAIGWNGVYLAELAGLSPISYIGPITGISLSITFAGAAIGPSLLAYLYGFLGSYAAIYGVLALTSTIGVLGVLMSIRTSRREDETLQEEPN